MVCVTGSTPPLHFSPSGSSALSAFASSFLPMVHVVGQKQNGSALHVESKDAHLHFVRKLRLGHQPFYCVLVHLSKL
jgi:hypothetical protein